MTPSPAIEGILNYMSQDVQSSLMRNGKVYLDRDTTGDDLGMHGLIYDKQRVTTLNGRVPLNGERPSLRTHGFQVVDRKLTTDTNFLEKGNVASTYYADCEKAVMEATGASRVYAFDHNIRSSDKKTQELLKIQSSLPLVHADYTQTSSPDRLAQLTEPPKLNDTYRMRHPAGSPESNAPLISGAVKDGCKRFAIVNVWRNIKDTPVQTMPLVCCDARSVTPDDFVVFEIRYSDRIGENYLLKTRPDGVAHHRWFVFPEMIRDEVILLKTWDSDGDFARSSGKSGDTEHATFAFHSALTMDPPAEGVKVPDRLSIEVRCMALFD